MKTAHRKTKTLAAFAAILGLTLTACGNGSGGGGGGGGDGDGPLAGAQLAVGSKEFTESKILGQITAVALEDAGADVTEKMGISGSATVREALESDEIDMYWDYTGTGWVNILGNTTENVPDDLYKAVKEADAQKNNIVWLEPAPFENTYRIAVQEEFAQQNDLANMSDAAEFIQDNPNEGAVCAASEFINRDDGLPGLEKFYNFEFSRVVELDLNLIYTQIGKECNFGEVFSTDARIASNNLTVLEDDKGFFVEYQGALTLRQETLKKHPAIEEIMAPISAALTDEVITELNGKVDTEGQLERDVAEEWLQSEGFIE
ncbi:ABC transporter substrate-binding protein [Arthrobacter pigmenti]